MVNDFFTEYAKKSDEEILQLAAERTSLTDEAAAALAVELSRRNLTHSDQAKYERFVSRNEERESKRRLRKLFGSRRHSESRVDTLVWFFWSAVVMAIITVAYQMLPTRYHFNSDWEEAAEVVMFTSVPIGLASKFSQRKMFFWVSLLISSAIHFILVHAWVIPVGSFSGPGHRGYKKAAFFIGFLLFLGVCGVGALLRRNFYGEEAAEGEMNTKNS